MSPAAFFSVSVVLVAWCIHGGYAFLHCFLPAFSTVQEALTKGSSARSPRAAAAALDALHKVIASFGTSVLDTKTMVKALPPLFDNKDKNVREKAKSVTVELAMWLGNNVVEKALLQKVRENQKREVEEMLSGVEAGSKRPSRFLRKHACMQHDQEQDANGDSTTEMNEQQSTAQHADAEELIEPTEILPKLNHARGDDRSFWDAIESQKWKERHEALTYLRSLTSAEKIADGDYHHLSSTLKKIIQKDANVACVTEACHALAGLVNGLGSHFRCVFVLFYIAQVLCNGSMTLAVEPQGRSNGNAPPLSQAEGKERKRLQCGVGGTACTDKQLYWAS